MREAPEIMFRAVKDALDRATAVYMMATQGEADLEKENLPTLMVKNTFLEVGDVKMADTKELKSQSCPIAAFSGCGEGIWDKESLPATFTGSSDIGMSELSKAARMFSTGDIPREAMEAAGLVTRRPSALEPTLEALGNTRPLPPPLLCEPEFPEPTMPEVPQWSPKVASVGDMMQARPVPPALQIPISTTVSRRPLGQVPVAPVPMAQSQPQPAPMPLQLGTPVRSSALFRVAYQGGVALRQGPYFDGVRTGAMLVHNEVFQVSEEVQGADGRLYLRLADGRGWAFDDSSLMPHDPSVVRGCWAPLSTTSAQSTFASTPASTVWEPMEEPMTPPGAPAIREVQETKKKRRRRKRGGVKRRPKNKVVLTEAAMSDDEIDTEAPSEAEVEIDILGSDGGSADARSSSSEVPRAEKLVA